MDVRLSRLLLALTFTLLGALLPRALCAAGAFVPFLTVEGDGWLVSNARHDASGWKPPLRSRPSFGLQMSLRNDIPFDRGTAGATIWVRQPSCGERFAAFGENCGWQLGMAVTQYRSLVVGGHGIEVDGLGAATPYGRFVNASDGRSRMVGTTTNVFADFSGVDRGAAPSWFDGIDVTNDAFAVRRAPAGSRKFDDLMSVDRNGALHAAALAQAASGQWAARIPLQHGSATFRFAKPLAATPVCVANSESGATLRVAPSPASCTITSSIADDSSYVDVAVFGHPD
jgi:hypothetical protein